MQVNIKFLPKQKIEAVQAIYKAFEELPSDFEESKNIIDEDINFVCFSFPDDLYKDCGYCDIFTNELMKHEPIKEVSILTIGR